MTIDELVALGKGLRDEELKILLRELDKEMTHRDEKAQMDCWNKVCETLDLYVRTYGYFTLINGDEEFTLYRGDYAFGELGEIAINE
jgi:hypothetical protein